MQSPSNFYRKYQFYQMNFVIKNILQLYFYFNLILFTVNLVIKTLTTDIKAFLSNWVSNLSNFCYSYSFVLKIKQNLPLYLVIILFPLEISIHQTVIFILWYIVFGTMFYLPACVFFSFLEFVLNSFVLLFCYFYLPIIGKLCFRFWLTCFVFQKSSGILKNSVASLKVLSDS